MDGEVTFAPELFDGNRAIVAFTGHAYLLTSQPPSTFDGLRLDGFGGALDPAVQQRVADGAPIGCLDVTMVGWGTGRGCALAETDRWDNHHRVVHARRIRSEVRVFGDDDGLFTIACGLAGRLELGIELAHPGTRPGAGRKLLTSALGVVDEGVPVFAAVAPGNARSLRAFLACGFVPCASEVIIER